MKTSKKTLLIFSPAFAASESDSVWLPWLQILVRTLNKNYPQVQLIIFSLQYPASTTSYTWHNNRVIPFNGMQKKRAARLLMWLQILIKSKQLHKQHNIIGIFSLWCGECTLLAKYAATILHTKYFCWIVGQDARASNNYVKRIRPNAASLIAMSDFLADEFYRNHHIKPQHIITNSIDASLFSTAPVNKTIDIIGVGSLIPLKRFNLFVEAIKRLKKSFPSIRVMLCGDGEERRSIEKLITAYELQHTIQLTGEIAHAQVLKYMQQSKILLHTSSYEGFVTVGLEALYAGAQVISFVKPMHAPIKNWHIVQCEDELLAKASEILEQPFFTPEYLLSYPADDSAKEIMKLFDQ
jgi:glycosyltransferase involved in cell wall biosynthesis